MKKILSRVAAVSTFAFAVLFSISSSASVTYHGSTNGVHHVTCTGGCSFSNAGWGRTSACDSGGICMTYFGSVREGEPGKPGQGSGEG